MNIKFIKLKNDISFHSKSTNSVVVLDKDSVHKTEYYNCSLNNKYAYIDIQSQRIILYEDDFEFTNDTPDTAIPDNKITSENYVQNVLRTESCDMNKIKERISDTEILRLLHAALGLATESGEFIDELKKFIFYGKPIDYVNLKEEIGGLMWYTGVAVDVLRTTLDDIMTCNIEKLKLRYPEKFNEDLAINRDTEKERGAFNE